MDAFLEDVLRCRDTLAILQKRKTANVQKAYRTFSAPSKVKQKERRGEERRGVERRGEEERGGERRREEERGEGGVQFFTSDFNIFGRILSFVRHLGEQVMNTEKLRPKGERLQVDRIPNCVKILALLHSDDSSSPRPGESAVE